MTFKDEVKETTAAGTIKSMSQSRAKRLRKSRQNRFKPMLSSESIPKTVTAKPLAISEKWWKKGDR